MHVTNSSPLPLYYQLREQMREKILSEEWPNGYEIPSELQLCEKLHLSRATVRQAIDDLVNENMLVRMRGKGTFVIYKKSNNFLTEPSFSAQVEQMGLTSSTKLLGVTHQTIDKNVALFLGISTDTQVVCYKRLRFISDREIAIDHNYVLKPYDKILENADLEKESVYSLLKYDRCKMSIRPVLLTPEEKNLLRTIQENDLSSLAAAGMLVEIISFYENHPVMYTKRCYRGDYCHLSLDFTIKDSGNEIESSSVVIKNKK